MIVATFGASKWAQLARSVAVPSAEAARPAELIVEHGETLHQARNAAAARVSAEWLCFLDADDELEPGYLSAMSEASADLRAPALRLVVAGEPDLDPLDLSGREILHGLNPCAIGTLIRRTMFDDVGGFWPERAWEDWSLFRRAVLAGATLEHVPAAVYRSNISPDGRNSTVDRPQQLRREIVSSHARWIRQRRTTERNRR